MLWVNLEGRLGGAEQSLLLFAEFAPRTIHVSAACPAGVLTKKLRRLGVGTYRIAPPPRTWACPVVWLFYLGLVNLQLGLIALRTRPRIIHANSAKAALAAALARLCAASVLVWHMRDWRCSPWTAAACGCLSARIIAVSRAVRDQLISLGVTPERIEVIYNGTTAGGAKTETQGHDGPITFANIGQFVPWKRQLLFVEAAERFLQSGLRGRFLLVGDDVFGRDERYRRTLVERVAASPFAGHIRIIGWRDTLCSLWPEIDCLVHTAEGEPFGRVIIEAMAQSVPVIAAAGAGPAELLTHRKIGLLFPPGDIEGLLASMRTIAENRELAHNLAAHGRQHMMSHFRAETTANKIVQIYEALVAA